MKDKSCKVNAKTSSKHPKRAVLFLKEHDASFVNVEEAFKALDEEIQDFFETSFDYWLEDHKRPRRFHGWDKSEFGGKYQECFVFKYDPHRFYGFLCHPKEPEDGRFLGCVLVLHAKKDKWKTDEQELKRAEQMRQDLRVQNACKQAFSAKKEDP